MTAQEKATQLINEYQKIKHSVSTHVNKQKSKQCALILCNETPYKVFVVALQIETAL